MSHLSRVSLSEEESGDERVSLNTTSRKEESVHAKKFVFQQQPHVNRMLKVDINVVNSCITGNLNGLTTPSPSSSSQSSPGFAPHSFQSSLVHSSLHSTLQTSLHSSISDTFRASDVAHDLPHDILDQGWRKFWSKREGRHYYFNKNTNESLWDLEVLLHRSSSHHQQRRISDPLGISSAPVTPTTPPEPSLNPIIPPSLKRSLSECQELPMKRLSTSSVGSLPGPWSLSTPNNSVIYERPPSLLHHPHPEVELFRGQLMSKLRSQYLEMCKSRANIEAPKESLNRWFMERKLIDKGGDPLFPSQCHNELSQSLYQEIMGEVPVKLIRPKFSGEARKQLTRYAEAAEKMIDSASMTPESRKIVKWNVEDTFQWIRKTLNANFDDYQERLRHLRQQCQPLLVEAAKQSVQGICLKIMSLSIEDAKRVNDKIQEMISEEKLKVVAHCPKLKNQSNPRKVYCYPVDLIQPPIVKVVPPVVVLVDKNSGITHVRYKNDSIAIKTLYLQKLEHLYRLNMKADPGSQVIQESLLLPRIYCLLKRYQSMMGDSCRGEGHCHEISLSLPVMDCLRKEFEVSFECFASPLNCFFKHFCSPFSDTDSYFGSRGSFLEFYPISGSFVCHPPVQEDLILSTVDHVEACLRNSREDPLSFVVVLPDFKADQEESDKAVAKLMGSQFKRESFSLPAFQHEFKTGFQHVLNQKEEMLKSQYPTVVVILQNDSGFLKWGPTPQRLDNLIDSFNIGRTVGKSSSSSSSDNPPMLSPPPTPKSSSSVQKSQDSCSNSNTSSSSPSCS